MEGVVPNPAEVVLATIEIDFLPTFPLDQSYQE